MTTDTRNARDGVMRELRRFANAGMGDVSSVCQRAADLLALPTPNTGESIESALRDSFPHFQDDAPVTPEAIRAVGNEWADMVLNWMPVPTKIEFYDQNGVKRFLVWETGDNSSGWIIDDQEEWWIATADDPIKKESAAK